MNYFDSSVEVNLLSVFMENWDRSQKKRFSFHFHVSSQSSSTQIFSKKLNHVEILAPFMSCFDFSFLVTFSLLTQKSA